MRGAHNYSVAGLTGPFRAPHQTIADVGLIGGGQVPTPGGEALAHHGILCLDALPRVQTACA
jgi:predicted ATPase with chaperone activity